MSRWCKTLETCSRFPAQTMQLELPFGPILNRDFLSNHWLDHRLPLEPEWSEAREMAVDVAAFFCEGVSPKNRW
jgi:hypothetical protein